jgi:hypothetical protein
VGEELESRNGRSAGLLLDLKEAVAGPELTTEFVLEGVEACTLSPFAGTFANPILTTDPDISRPFKSARALIASFKCTKLTNPQFLCVLIN